MPNNSTKDKNAYKEVSDSIRIRNKIYNKEALNITLKYGIFGALWVLLSDRLLAIIVQNSSIYMKLQTAKGWLYIVITMLLIYNLINKKIKIIKESGSKIKEAYDELKQTHEEVINIERELRYQKDILQNIIDNSPVIISLWDEGGKIKNLNPYAQKLFGYKEDEVMNQNWLELLIPENNKSIMEGVMEEIKLNGQIRDHESEFMSKDGERINIIWNSKILDSSNLKQKYQVVSVGINNTERKKQEEKIKKMAYYDSLTGLPNKVLFMEETSRCINKSMMQESMDFAIIYLDIDNFKYINDTLNHSVGDEFLKYFADKLKQHSVNPTMISRFTGDEFVVLWQGLSQKQILEYVEELLKKIGNTWSMNNYQFYISVTVGIAVFPEHGSDLTELLKSAEIAMYAAKHQGKNKIQVFEPTLMKLNYWNMEMANKIQMGLDNKEFSLYYQPQFSLKTNRITSAEALIRWNHKKKEAISPAEFIPVAEQTGQIYEIEQWIFKTALQQKKDWEDAGYNNLGISINLSAKTLISDIYFHKIEKLISFYEIDYSNVTIEITETAILTNIKLVIERLNGLKMKGLKIALDDFGTGYSSLAYLKELPIDTIKLDQSYVNAVPYNQIDAHIVKAIISLSHDLNYDVIAEGIETIEQLVYLRMQQCEDGQGFLLSKPLPSEEMAMLFEKTMKGYERL
jgi:diguanylate cyclase (GGDEF)-like protein/PAS domain S-box-containing protein